MPVKINKTQDTNISSLNTYLIEVRKDKLLTSEEEKILSRRIINGDKRARETLINSNLRLVVKIAKGYLTSDMELQDLIQEGNLGLIKAADKFDFKKMFGSVHMHRSGSNKALPVLFQIKAG